MTEVTRGCDTSTCVEVRFGGAFVWLFDTEHRAQQAQIPLESWRQFLVDVKAGKFDEVAP